MKLSEMELDHVFDVIGVAGEELGAFFEDEVITKKLETLNTKADGETVSAFGVRRAKDFAYIIAAVGKKYKKGLYNLVGAFKQVPPESVGNLSLPEMWEQIRDSLNDELFLGFFPSLRSWVGKSLTDMLLKPDLADPSISSDTLSENTKKIPYTRKPKKDLSN